MENEVLKVALYFLGNRKHKCLDYQRPSSSLHGCQRHMWYTETFRQNTYIHKIKYLNIIAVFSIQRIFSRALFRNNCKVSQDLKSHSKTSLDWIFGINGRVWSSDSRCYRCLLPQSIQVYQTSNLYSAQRYQTRW